jgi:RNA polymerase sigma-70 factor (ECF subfamily)
MIANDPAQLPQDFGGPDSTLDALLARVAEGDTVALAALYDRSSTMVYSVAVRILSNAEDAEEVTVDVYTHIWRSAGTYKATRGTAATWLMMLARSRALDRLRSARARNCVPCNGNRADERLILEPPLACNGSMAPFDQQILMKAALNQLPEGDRELLRLAFFGGLSHSELASTLKLPLGTVKTRIGTAVSRLRELIR